MTITDMQKMDSMHLEDIDKLEQIMIGLVMIKTGMMNLVSILTLSTKKLEQNLMNMILIYMAFTK